MKLIVGLGNPEERYQYSRHNIGFMVVDGLAKQITQGPTVEFGFNKKFKALIFEANFPLRGDRFVPGNLGEVGMDSLDGGRQYETDEISATALESDHRGHEKIFLVKPQTYVNNSGWTVKLIACFYQVDPVDIWIVHDDIDLPLSKLRVRIGGGSGGHNGIESILKHLGTDQFVRFRLGIGRGKLDTTKSTAWNLHRRAVTDFVLSPFTKSEKGTARTMIRHAEKAILLALEKGLEQVMNRFN